MAEDQKPQKKRIVGEGDHLFYSDGRASLAAQLEPVLGAERANYYAGVIGGVRRESIEASLGAIEARYPNFETYLSAECGVTPEMLAHIRAQYLE